MKFRKMIAGSLALSAVFAAAMITAPAEAKSLRSYINGALGARGGFNANASVELSNLSNTAATLDSMINTGLSTGRISPAQANAYRAQLNNIQNTQASFMADGNLNAGEVQSLVAQYTNLTSQVNGSLNYGYNYGYGNQYTPYNTNYYGNPYDYQYPTNYYG